MGYPQKGPPEMTAAGRSGFLVGRCPGRMAGVVLVCLPSARLNFSSFRSCFLAYGSAEVVQSQRAPKNSSALFGRSWVTLVDTPVSRELSGLGEE